MVLFWERLEEPSLRHSDIQREDVPDCVYPTHSYTDERPKLRWVFPLSAPITPEQYKSVAYNVGKLVGTSTLDARTYQPERIMYWPACSNDFNYAAHLHAVTDGRNLDPEADGLLDPDDTRADMADDTRADVPEEYVSFVLPSEIPEGCRDDTLFRYGCSLRAKGLSEESVRDELYQANDELCLPPLPDEQVEQKIAQVCKYRRGTSQALTTDGGRVFADLAPLVDSAALTEAVHALIDEVRGAGEIEMDLTNALLRLLSDRLLFTPGHGWLLWDGKRYVPNQTRAEEAVMDATAWVISKLDTQLAVTSSRGDTEQAKRVGELLTKVRRYNTCTKRKALMDNLEKKLYAEDTDLDADPFLLNTQDGAVDLRTGELREHSRDDKCTKITAVGIGDKGKQMWSDFVNLVSGGDKELAEYMQYCFGMSAIGEVGVETLVLIQGDGGTGKSTFVNAIRDCFGLYACGLEQSVLLRDSTGTASARGVAKLPGKRMAIISELSERATLAEEQLKKLCSTDLITARQLYREAFDFQPSHTLFLFTNFLPRVSGMDWGTWRRLIALPFDVKMKGDKLNYGKTLFTEAGEAIMSWVVEGAVKYLKADKNLPPCKVASKKVKEYQRSQDVYRVFLDEEFIEDPEGRVEAGLTIRTYNRWAREMNELPTNGQTFGRAMKRLGHGAVRSHGVRYYPGLTPRTGAPHEYGA